MLKKRSSSLKSILLAKRAWYTLHMAWWNSWHYKNLTFFFVGIAFALTLSSYEPFHQFLLHLGNLGYIGAFIGGILFVSTFTVVTGAVILLVIAESLPLLPLGIIAGAGAVLGDLTIFRLVRDGLLQEVEEIYHKINGNHQTNHLTKLMHSKYFHWTLPVVGAIIIASPFPDELGISLMGIAKMKTYRFILLSFILNTLGIIAVLSASSFLKP